MRNFDILMTNLFSFSTRATRMQTMIIKINSKLPRPSRITSSFVRLMSLPSRLPIEAQTFITIILRTWVLLNGRNMNFYELFFFELYFKEKIMKSVHEFWWATSLIFNPCKNFEIHFEVFDKFDENHEKTQHKGSFYPQARINKILKEWDLKNQ